MVVMIIGDGTEEDSVAAAREEEASTSASENTGCLEEKIIKSASIKRSKKTEQCAPETDTSWMFFFHTHPCTIRVVGVAVK